jgi:putative ABC transport system permease protein
LMFVQLGFKNALLDSNTSLPSRLQTDLVITSQRSQSFGQLDTFSRRRLYQIKNLPEVAFADPLYVNIGSWKNPQTQKDASVVVLGFSPARSALIMPEVKQNLSLIQYPDTLLFDQDSSGEYQETIAKVTQGKLVTTEIQGRKIAIKGLYKIGSSFIADGSVVTSDQNFLRIYKDRIAGQVSIGLITLKPGYDSTTVAAKMRSQLPKDIKVFTLKEFVAAERAYTETGTSIGFIFSFGVVVGFLVGLIIVYQILFADVSDHLPEYATLKAMGYSDLYFLSVVFQESIILAIAGFIPSYLIAIVLYEFIKGATGLLLVLTISLSGQVLVLTIIMCIVSGGIATQKLRSADPADVF